MAFFRPMTFLAYSITAICIPRQIPKKGISLTLAYSIDIILPSTPLSPKPGATKTPSRCEIRDFTFVLSIDSEWIGWTFTFTEFTDPA